MQAEKPSRTSEVVTSPADNKHRGSRHLNELEMLFGILPCKHEIHDFYSVSRHLHVSAADGVLVFIV